jgi:plastocyanin
MRLGPRMAAALIALAAVGGACAGEVFVDVRGSDGKPLAEAVVYAEPIGATVPAVVIVPHATIDQVNKEFVPRVSIVRVGTTINFPNGDNIRHSIYSFSQPKTFTTKLYAGRDAPPVVFDNTGLVVLGCNIHDTMVAWIVIVDTPWFGKSDARGVGALKGLPPGEYKVSAWYPSPGFTPATAQVRVGEGSARQEVRLDAEATVTAP